MPHATKFIPKQRAWDNSLLETEALNINQINPGEALGIIRPDLEAEYDANRLCERLVTAAETEGVVFSPEFKACELLWRRDEFRHYQGFRRIWSLISGQLETEVDGEMAAAESDFSELQVFFGSEQGVSVLVVYDELTTVRSYREDLPMYRAMGSNFEEWFKLVISDEVFHYGNFLQVIRHNHRHKLSQALEFLRLLIELDKKGAKYNRTFVLDRRANTFDSQSFIQACGEAVEAAIIMACK